MYVWLIHILPLLLQVEPDLADQEGEALALAVVGMAVVFLALLIVGGMIMLTTKLLDRGDKSAVADFPPKVAPGPVAAGLSSPMDGRTLALLTAAACAAVGRPVRVRHITFLNKNTISAWSEAGRISIQSSHNLRRSI